MASKASFVQLLARNVFHCMAKSYARLFASEESNQLFASGTWMPRILPTDLLFLEKISLFAKDIAVFCSLL